MFDPKSLELAEYFLRDNLAATDEHKSDLAQAIQDAVEDFTPPREEVTDNGPVDPYILTLIRDDPFVGVTPPVVTSIDQPHNTLFADAMEAINIQYDRQRTRLRQNHERELAEIAAKEQAAIAEAKQNVRAARESLAGAG